MLYALSWLMMALVWWILGVTAALPLTLLIKYNTASRRKVFSWVLVYMAAPLYIPRSIPWRKKVFETLKADMEKRDASVPLEFLEIGVGEGPNLQFYPENCNLTVLDHNKWFESYYYANSKKFSHINYKGTVICPAEDMHGVEDNSMDVVVSTYLHCSCQDSEKVLKEVKRVLKPGGKYVFLEHVCFPRGDFGLKIQRFLNPLWKLYLDGCHLDRDTGSKIRNAGFSDVICDDIQVKDWWMYLARHEVTGIATK